MGPFFSGGMGPALGGRTVVMYFHELVYNLLFVRRILQIVYSLLLSKGVLRTQLIANGSQLLSFQVIFFLN